MNILQKVYRYHQLNEVSKKTATNNVHDLESPHYQNDTHTYNYLAETVKSLLKEIHLDIKEDEIDWNYDYTFSLDITETQAGINTFYEHYLPSEDYRIFIGMQELLEDVMEVSFFGRDKEDGIQIDPNVGEYDIFDIDDEVAVLKFILEYAHTEELKNKYKFQLLFMEASEEKEELPEHIREDLDGDFEEVTKYQAKRLEELLNTILAPKYRNIYEIAKGIINYGGSVEFYKNELESTGCSTEQRYLFDAEGKVVLIDDEFEQSDFINVYEEKAEA